MKKFIKPALGLAACLTVTMVAYAAVMYDPAEGGFVGKGDVQTPLGLNNAKMQQTYGKVEFGYEATATYSFDCEWYTGPDQNRTHHVNTISVSLDIPAVAVLDTPKKNASPNLTGWFLDAIDLSGVDLQPTDADCGAEGNANKTIVPGTVEQIGDTTGGLFFTYQGGDPIPLPNTP